MYTTDGGSEVIVRVPIRELAAGGSGAVFGDELRIATGAAQACDFCKDADAAFSGLGVLRGEVGDGALADGFVESSFFIGHFDTEDDFGAWW